MCTAHSGQRRVEWRFKMRPKEYVARKMEEALLEMMDCEDRQEAEDAIEEARLKAIDEMIAQKKLFQYERDGEKYVIETPVSARRKTSHNSERQHPECSP